MKNMLRRRRWVVTGVLGVVLSLVASVAVIAPRVSEAFTLIERGAWGFGPSQILAGEQATLGVYNFGDGSVVVELTIFDATQVNTILKQQQLTLSPKAGNGITFQNTGANGGPMTGEIAAVIAIIRSTTQGPNLLGTLATSLEIANPASPTNRLHLAPTLLPAVQ